MRSIATNREWTSKEIAVQGQGLFPSTDSAARELLELLLGAETEAEVHERLDGAHMLDVASWLPYGGDSNNSGTFANQQASPRGALVEKIVNSIDAVLMAKAFEHGDLPGGSPPASMFDAAERYFDVREGRLAEITSGRPQRKHSSRGKTQCAHAGTAWTTPPPTASHRAPSRRSCPAFLKLNSP